MVGVLLSLVQAASGQEGERPRVRDLGLRPGILTPGRWNAITDVPGVRVGHRTVWEGEGVRTGVTVILPHEGNLFQEKVPAAVWVGNGFGKAAGFLQVRELGTLETPIALTNTVSVGVVWDALVRWTLAQPGNEDVRSVNAVVGETNDGLLNDIRGAHVRPEHVWEAIASARPGPVEEGTVGGGTGTVCLGWKGGIGTASRVLPARYGGYVVGVLVQTNFGGILHIDGVPVGRELGRFFMQGDVPYERPDGSCMIVVATNAPLDRATLERMAHRAILGMARTGSFMANGSGDFVIAFSTAYRIPHRAPEPPVLQIPALHPDALNPLFLAVVEATEEAIYNSLFRATTVTGFGGRTVEALPLERVREILRRYGRLP